MARPLPPPPPLSGPATCGGTFLFFAASLRKCKFLLGREKLFGIFEYSCLKKNMFLYMKKTCIFAHMSFKALGEGGGIKAFADMSAKNVSLVGPLSLVVRPLRKMRGLEGKPKKTFKYSDLYYSLFEIASFVFRLSSFVWLWGGRVHINRTEQARTPGDKLQMGYKSIMRTD